MGARDPGQGILTLLMALTEDSRQAFLKVILCGLPIPLAPLNSMQQ